LYTVAAILNFILILALFVATYLVKKYFPSYFDKKAANLATKEDFGDITKQDEGIKYEYSSEIESLKAAIGSHLYIHQTRYRNEFNMLKELSEKIVNLRDSALGLRPEMDDVDSNEPEYERKKKRLNRYHEAATALYRVYETRKPFLPDKIYEGFRKLDKVVWKEVVEHKNRSVQKSRRFDPKYWDKARNNAEQISKAAESLTELIRVRVKSWETFKFDRS